MKKKIVAVSLALSSVVSFNVQAEGKILFDNNLINVVQFSDEFTEEITSCQINLGEYSTKKPRVSVYIGKRLNMGMAAYAGNFDASGLMVKVDSGKTYQYGSTYAGGDSLHISAPDGFLEEVASGSKLIVRAHPDNRYADSMTSKYSLNGSSKAVAVFNKCKAKL